MSDVTEMKKSCMFPPEGSPIDLHSWSNPVLHQHKLCHITEGLLKSETTDSHFCWSHIRFITTILSVDNVSQFQSDWMWSSSTVLVEKHNQGIILVSVSVLIQYPTDACEEKVQEHRNVTACWNHSSRSDRKICLLGEATNKILIF